MERADLMPIEVSASQVPTIIQEQFKGLSALRENVSKATEKAENAMERAEVARGKSAGLFHKKEAIESLQEATVDLADAQIAAAQAQEVSFEYQQKIAEITKYLFALGVSNIAMNRCVVRELELKLKGASEEELDELARQEICAVVKQLKAQEDIMKKQEDMGQKVKAHELTLRNQEKKDLEYDKRLKAQEDHDKKQDILLKERSEKDKEQDKLIAGNRQRTIEHEKMLAEQAEEARNRDKEIARQAEKDEELTDMFNQLVEADVETEIQLKDIMATCEKLSADIVNLEAKLDGKDSIDWSRVNKKASKTSVVISYVIGLAGLIAGILGVIF